MPGATDQDRGVIAFGEKLLTLLDEGSFTATYKYAVLLGLIDLCMRHSTREGAPPRSVSTRQLAERIIEMYWPHTTQFEGKSLLLQNRGGQAEILSTILRFRSQGAFGPSTTLVEAQTRSAREFERLLDHVEWKLAEMPLPRLQTLGSARFPFLYRIPWNEDIRRSDFQNPAFDRSIRFEGNAGEYLVRLSGLLRPLIQRQWAAMVAALNRDLVQDSQLERFLFGAERIPLERVRDPLRELQENRCFYCDRRLPPNPVVDHFVPWSRYPDNGIENLVAADERCNSAKRNFLSAADHLARWTSRFSSASCFPGHLAGIARTARWERHPEQTLGVARTLYLGLPPDAKLWIREKEFAEADLPKLRQLLTLPDPGRQPLILPPDDPRSSTEAFKTLLPLYSLKAACGKFGEGEPVDPEGWMDASRIGRLSEDMFVARAAGRSMEPKIHDGDYLVFRANPQGSRQGKIVLAQYRGPADPDTGGAYTVKRYRSEKTVEADTWRHEAIRLEPLNPEFKPIVIRPEGQGDIKVVAELISTLFR